MRYPIIVSYLCSHFTSFLRFLKAFLFFITDSCWILAQRGRACTWNLSNVLEHINSLQERLVLLLKRRVISFMLSRFFVWCLVDFGRTINSDFLLILFFLLHCENFRISIDFLQLFKVRQINFWFLLTCFWRAVREQLVKFVVWLVRLSFR